jgi:hypothetical protein
MSKITVEDLARYVESHPIEAVVALIDIEEVEDPIIRTILHTLDHSISRLREELN